MTCFKIKGGSSLNGTIKAQGSKNASLPILAASLLSSRDITISGLSRLSDISILSGILQHCGKEVHFESNNVLRLRESGPITGTPPQDLIKRMRASFLILGPLLARTGKAAVSLPGGDAIGARPVDIHLAGLEAMGAQIEIRNGSVFAQADRLKPSEIYLKYPSVGATEHLMMTAALIPGRTVLHNCAQEPEIEDLAQFLRKLGAVITRSEGNIEIEGREKLQGADHKVIPDRLHAGTMLIAAALTKGEVKIECVPEHLTPLTSKLKEAGLELEESASFIKVRSKGVRSLEAMEIETQPYPGFPTDMQPLIMPLLTRCNGTSRITEAVFEDRFAYVEELRKMGADVEVSGQSAIIKYVDKLHGAQVYSHDIRAGAALVLAGLVAEGSTIVHDPDEHIARGYDDLGGDLQRLSAEISMA